MVRDHSPLTTHQPADYQYRSRHQSCLLATLLYHQWGQLTPTLFDPVAVAFAISPEICPTTKMRLEIDDKGFTRPAPGAINAEVCLNSKSDDFFQLYMTRVLNQNLAGHCSRQEPPKH